ncbi:hypothetical protein GCM10020000_06670 [Streptomyces olivoverticillatus]
MKARTFIPPTDEEITAVLSIAPKTDAGAVTINAAGEAYANRPFFTVDDVLTSNGTSPGTQPKESIVMTKEDTEAAERALLEQQVDREINAAVGTDPDDDGPVPDVDADQELPPVEARPGLGVRTGARAGVGGEGARGGVGGAGGHARRVPRGGP